MKRGLKIILILTVIFFTVCSVVGVQAIEKDKIDYTETLESFENPERGFYQYFYYNFKVSGNELPKSDKLKSNLVHLRLGIGDFSKALNGKEDLEFSRDMLDMFSQILKSIKSNGGTAIIRFAYDNFEGEKNKEPSLDMLLKHISQLKPIFEENKDVITYIELGFFGPWGEMHSSDVCTTDNVSKAMDQMLDAAPERIKIGVRQPKYYAAWANIERSELNKNITQEGTDSYRIGLYNDGYLGSESDLGTFKNREIEIQWLEKQATHTLYGGEVVGNRANAEPLNTAKYMSEEAFRTHTTYLNKAYDKTVIESWKAEIYNGKDILYKGQSGYTYINNHLGYRFVLRKSEITGSVTQNEKLNVSIGIENVGFANLVNDKVVTLVLVKEDERQEIKTDLDPTKWNSIETANMNLEIELPQNISLGEWKVYLRISQYGDINTDNSYQCIRLANNNIWNQDIGANYIGDFVVIDKQYDSSEEVEDNIQKDEIKNVIVEEKLEKIEFYDKYEEVIIQEGQLENERYEEDIVKDKVDKEKNVENAKNYTENGYKKSSDISNKFLIFMLLLVIFFVVLLTCFCIKRKK